MKRKELLKTIQSEGCVFVRHCISVGDSVGVSIRDGVIVITPVKRPRGELSLQELVSRIPKNYNREEVEWGGPVGRKNW